MMILLSIILFALSGEVLAETLSQSDKYMDKVLVHLRSEGQLSKLDRLDLPDFKIKINHEGKISNTKVKMSYQQGLITGLSLVHRDGKCTLPVKKSGSTTITCKLIFPNVEIKHNAKMNYGLLRSYTLQATAKMAPRVFVEITMSPNSKSPIVKEKKIIHTEAINPSFTGEVKHLELEEKIAFGDFVTKEFSMVMDKRFFPIFSSAVSSVAMPLSQ